MANIKPLANRHNVVKPSDGNGGMRYRDATATVANVITGGKLAGASKKGSGCKSCGK